MNLQLTTWERLTISQLIGRLQGDAALIYRAIRLFDILELTDEEKEKVNFHVSNNKFEWDSADHLWDIKIPSEELDLIRQVIENNRTWPAARAREIAKLYDKLACDWPVLLKRE